MLQNVQQKLKVPWSIVECFSGLAPETHVFEVWVHGSKVAEVNFSNVHLFFAEKISSHFLCGFLAKRAGAAPPFKNYLYLAPGGRLVPCAGRRLDPSLVSEKLPSNLHAGRKDKRSFLSAPAGWTHTHSHTHRSCSQYTPTHTHTTSTLTLTHQKGWPGQIGDWGQHTGNTPIHNTPIHPPTGTRECH